MKILSLLAGVILLPILSLAQPTTVPRPGTGGGSSSSTTTVAQIIAVGDTNYIRNRSGFGSNTTLLGNTATRRITSLSTNATTHVLGVMQPGSTYSVAIEGDNVLRLFNDNAFNVIAFDERTTNTVSATKERASFGYWPLGVGGWAEQALLMEVAKAASVTARDAGKFALRQIADFPAGTGLFYIPYLVDTNGDQHWKIQTVLGGNTWADAVAIPNGMKMSGTDGVVTHFNTVIVTNIAGNIYGLELDSPGGRWRNFSASDTGDWKLFSHSLNGFPLSITTNAVASILTSTGAYLPGQLTTTGPQRMNSSPGLTFTDWSDGTDAWQLNVGTDFAGRWLFYHRLSSSGGGAFPFWIHGAAASDALIIGKQGVTNNGAFVLPNISSNATPVAALVVDAAGNVSEGAVSSGNGFPLTATVSGADWSITNLHSLTLGPSQNPNMTSNAWIYAQSTNGQTRINQFLSYATAGASAATLSTWQLLMNGTNGITNVYSMASTSGGNTGSSITEILTDAMYRWELIQGQNDQRKFTMEVDSTPYFAWMTNQFVLTNGLVGIGTATPAAALQVSGTTFLSGSSGVSIIGGGIATDTATPGNSQGAVFGATGAKWRSGGTIEWGDSASGFYGSTDTKIYRLSPGIIGTTNIYASGNVGIGTTTPTERLSVIGNYSGSGTNFSTNGFACFDTNAPIAFSTTGYTNRSGRNISISLLGTALTVTKFETNSTQLFSWGAVTGPIKELLKPNQYITTSGTLTSNNVEPF